MQQITKINLNEMEMCKLSVNGSDLLYNNQKFVIYIPKVKIFVGKYSTISMFDELTISKFEEIGKLTNSKFVKNIMSKKNGETKVMNLKYTENSSAEVLNDKNTKFFKVLLAFEKKYGMDGFYVKVVKFGKSDIQEVEYEYQF